MFSLVSGVWNSYFNYPELKILIVGEEKVGKSTFLEHLRYIYTGKGQNLLTIGPTCGLNLVKFKVYILTLLKYSNNTLCFWDVSGKASYRGMWENYLNWSDGLIFMMEAGKDDYTSSVDILNSLLNKEEENKIPILILINKIDSVEISSETIKKIYDAMDFTKLKKRNFLIMLVSALNGKGIEDSVKWLYTSLLTDTSKKVV